MLIYRRPFILVLGHFIRAGPSRSRPPYAQALALAQELRRAIAALEVATSRGALSATASFGCATLDEADGSIDALIALADARLYAAKHAGRNRVGHRYACAA